MITLDDLIAAAMKARGTSPLGGGTIVHLCEYEREYMPMPIYRAILDTDPEHPEDGATFLVCI